MKPLIIQNIFITQNKRTKPLFLFSIITILRYLNTRNHRIKFGLCYEEGNVAENFFIETKLKLLQKHTERRLIELKQF